MCVSCTTGPRQIFVGTINTARQLISEILAAEEVPKGSRRDQTSASLTVKMILVAIAIGRESGLCGELTPRVLRARGHAISPAVPF